MSTPSINPLTQLNETLENIQARIRGNLLMALSNKFGGLVLNTGNKSELAVGYCTQYGDMVGALSVISDLYKGEVYALAKFMNRKKEIIPERILTRAPSAELRADQVDQDSLPPYEQLDEVLRAYIEGFASKADLVGQGMDPDLLEKVEGLLGRA